MEARTQAIQELQGNLKGLAGKLAPHYYNDLVSRVEGRTAARFARAAKRLQPQGEPESILSGNGSGKHTYHAEVDSLDPTKATRQRKSRG